MFLMAMMATITIHVMAQRLTDKLDRGLVAIETDAGVFCSWRVLAEEYYDVTYNLYRDGVKVNAEPLTVSDYTDAAGTATSKACSFIFCDYAFKDMPGDTIMNFIVVTDRESYEKDPYSYKGGAIYAEFSYDSNGNIKRFTIEESGLVSVTDR